ncbi:MAG: DUF1598 domain-containing protein [Thermoguttaceae bacterium]
MRRISSVLHHFVLIFSLVFLFVLPCQSTFGQGQVITTGGSVVGGVEVDAEGVLRTAPRKEMEGVGRIMKKLLEPIPADLDQATPIRKISLKKLDADIRALVEKKEALPDSILFFGGMTSIQYIIVVPEENDILLVGPAEGWMADSFGNIIGKTSGKPILRLEDFVTIFRTWNNQERPAVITCSIDPTPASMANIAKLEREFPPLTKQNLAAFAAAQEVAYGMNVVSIKGVPDQSRFAKVLVAADYKMKRIGLGQESSNVSGLPSYVSLLSGSRQQINPRFWLAPEYSTVSHDSTKLTWQLGEVSVKALTENEYIDSRSGTRQKAEKLDGAAMNWCAKMTNKYNALSKVDPVFGDLKNCMELAIAVALIHREDLLNKANCKVSCLADTSLLPLPQYPVPRQVPSQATISRNGRTNIVACGGVEINPFATLQQAKLDNKIDADRKSLVQTSGNSWWSK